MDLFNTNPHGLSPEERAAIGALRFGKANPIGILSITRAVHNSYTSRKIRPPANLDIVKILDGALMKGIPIVPAAGGEGYYLADTAGELAAYQRQLGSLKRLINKRLHAVAYVLRTMKGMWGTNPAAQTPPNLLTSDAVRELEQAHEVTIDDTSGEGGADESRPDTADDSLASGTVQAGKGREVRDRAHRL